MVNIIYIRSDNRTFNNTDNISKHINQYTTVVVSNYKTNKVSNLKKAYYMLIDDVINKHNTIYTNDNTNVAKINKLVNFNGNNYFTKKIEHTNNIINNIKRDNRNQEVNEHITHIHNYGNVINTIIRNHLITIFVMTFTMVLSILERMK